MTAATAAKQRYSLSSLIEQIVARREQSALLTYWLLDRSALPLGRWLKDWSAGDAAVDLLGGRRSIEPTGVTPVLIHARSLHASPARTQRKLEELMSVAAVSNSVGLLRSTLTLEALQVALQARTRVVLPQGLQAVLRYFDTRALPLLPRLLTPAQYAWMLEPVSEWHYLDRWGQLRQLPAPVHSEAKTLQPQPDGLVLDEAQEAMLIDDGLTDAIIDRLLTQQHEALIEASPPEQFEIIDPLVNAARTAGVDDHAEVFALVVKSLQERAIA